MNHNHLVIMAGGIGSRFWPMSDENLPKQFIDILGCGKSMLQVTLERFKDIVPMENIWVVTLERYRDLVKEQLPELKEENLVLEPCGRNTAPCVCYVSWKIKKRDPRANVVVSPADHDIRNVENFREVIQEAMAFTSETDSIVTLGLKPSRPETGYGYIKADLSVSSSRKKNIFRVDAFREKPDRELAELYIQQPNMFWNSGLFVWSVSTIVNAFRVYQPEMSHCFEDLLPFYDTPKEKEMIQEVYAKQDKISVDYAIMEKAEDVFVYPADFGWSDLGTWGSLLNQLPRDPYGNAVVGDAVKLFDSHNCVIHASTAKQVVIQGLDDCVVAEKDGVLLICKLSEEQRIKLFH